jgi:glycerol-3-phosphate dehydrogenase (NAD(P)+)
VSVWAVIGDGPWGRALARRLASADHTVHLVGERPSRRKRVEGVTHGVDAHAALEAAERVILALPSAALEPALDAMAPAFTGQHRVLTTSRGLTPATYLRASEALMARTCVRQIAVIAGAADADALRYRRPTALVVGSAFTAWATEIQVALRDERLRIYTNADVVGVELANALARVMAVAMGAARAMNVGAATESTALTRALAEMARLVEGMGGKAQTAYGLAGLGVLTTMVFQGKGGAFGAGIGLVKPPEKAEPAQDWLLDVAHTMATRAGHLHLRAPMVEGVAALLSGKVEPAHVMGALMGRAARAE